MEASDSDEPLLVAGAPQASVIRGFGGTKGFWTMFVLLVALQTADGTLCVVLFDVWGSRYSIFINQGGAFVYITWSVLALYALQRQSAQRQAAQHHASYTVEKPAARRNQLPRSLLVLIGLMNGSANFCMAVAQPHTPGLSQTLLLLLGVPLVLLFSWIALGKRPSSLAAAAASLIVAGTAISGMRTVLQPESSEPVAVFGWAILLFAAAQLFLAAEKVVEEATFTTYDSLHPMVMFCWTLTTQFVLGWALYPLQTIPELGGISLADVPAIVRDGIACTAGLAPCTPGHAVVFWAYTCVDFWCYYMGLWVIQRGGASLLVLVTAVALPLQQLALCARPLLGRWAETFFWGDAIALLLVLLGFGVYQGLSPEGRAARLAGSAPAQPAEGEGSFGTTPTNDSFRATGRSNVSACVRREASVSETVYDLDLED